MELDINITKDNLIDPRSKSTNPKTTDINLNLSKEDLYSLVPSSYSGEQQGFMGNIGAGQSKYDARTLPSDIEEYGLDYIRASQQPWTEQAGRAIGGGLYKGVLTALEDTSYLLDFESHINSFTGVDDMEGNAISNFAKSVKDSFDKNHPIFRYNPEDPIDMSDPGFYWTALQGIVDSAVGFGIVGAGVGATVGRGAKFLTSLGKFGAPIENAIATGTTALVTNYAEGKMMAVESFGKIVNDRMSQVDDQLYKTAFEQVKSINPTLDNRTVSEKALELVNSDEFLAQRDKAEKEIRSYAGEEMSKFIDRNRIFMISDALAINGMFRGQGFTRNLLKEKSIKNTAMMIAKQAPTEYAEEVGQGLFQKEGEYQAMKNAGMDVSDISSDPIKRTWDFFTDPSTQLEGFMGLFGGPVQHVLVQAPVDLANRNDDKEYRNRQTQQVKENEQLLNGLIAQRTKNEQLKNDAFKRGNTAVYNLIKDDEFSQLAYRNFTSGTTENLETDLKEVSEMTPEEATAKGYEPTYKQDADDRLSQLLELEKDYTKIARKFSGEKENLLHNKLYTINARRNAITNEIGKLKQEQSDLVNKLKNEIQTLDNTTVSSDQMRLKNIESSIQLLGKTKAKVTAARNEALLKPNARLKKAELTYYNELAILNNMKASKDKFTQDELLTKNNEVVALRDNYNRLSNFAGEETKNQDTVDRVNKLHDGRIKGIGDQIEQLQKEKDEVKNKLKDNKEKISAFNEKDYSKWEDIKELEEFITDLSEVKKAYDTEYSNIVSKKAQYISEITKAQAEAEAKAVQEDVNKAKTTQDKKDIIDGQSNPEVKDNLHKDNDKKIQDDERANREEAGKRAVVTNPKVVEETKATQETHEKISEPPLDGEVIRDIEKDVKNTEDFVRDLNREPSGSDQGEITYEYKRSKKGWDILAYLSRMYEKFMIGKAVYIKDIDDALNEESFIKILNPNKYGAGTKVILKEVNNLTTVINFTTKETWGEFVEKIKTSDDIENLYRDNVPIGLYDENDNLIGYLHTDEWISEEHIYGDVEKAKNNLRTIREYITKNTKFATTIKSKATGYLFRSIEGAQKLSKINNDPNVIYAVGGRDDFFTTEGIEHLNIKNRDKVISGRPYMIVQTGIDEKGKVYIAFPVVNDMLINSKNVEKITESILNAIRIYYKRARNEDLTTDEKNVEKAIGDLGTYTGLTEYINQFVQVYFNAGNLLKDEVRKFKNASTKTLFSIDRQQIRFITEGAESFLNPLNTTPQQLEKLLDKLATKILPVMYSNISKNTLINPNKPVKAIIKTDEGYATEDIYNNYVDYMKENTKTDILSKEIDNVDGKPVFSYTIQPRIVIDFDEIVPPEIDKPSTKEDTTVTENVTTSEQVDDGYVDMNFTDTFGNPDIDGFTFGTDESPFLPEEVLEKVKTITDDEVTDRINKCK